MNKVLFCLLTLYSMNSIAHEHFNLNALEYDNPNNVDASKMEYINQGLSQVPGIYRVTVFLNDNFISEQDIEFSAIEGHDLYPVLHKDFFNLLGLTPNSIEKILKDYNKNGFVILEKELPQTRMTYDLGKLNLNITLPQEYIQESSSELLNNLSKTQTSAAFIDYDMDYSRTKNHEYGNGQSDSYYVNLLDGLNIGDWHARNSMNFSKDMKAEYLDNSYIERDVLNLRSRLTIGDYITNSDVYDGIHMRGVQLSSQEDMLADKELGFSPTIHGIAVTESEITIRRKGSVLYRKLVPAGPYMLRDLPSEAGDGEIEVSVKDASGKVTVSKYDFTSLPIMQRKGMSKYNLSIGYLPSSFTSHMPLIQMSYIKGILNELTLFGGVITSNFYNSFVVGTGISLHEIGAFSLGVTNQLIGGELITGGIQSKYYKEFEGSETMLSISNTTFPDSKFVSLEQQSILSSISKTQYKNRLQSQILEQLQVNINQRAFVGDLYLSVNKLRYRNKTSDELSVNAGYNIPFMGANIMLNLARVMYHKGKGNENQISLMVQIPLDIFSHNFYSGVNMTSSGKTNTLATQISGYGLDDDRLSFTAQKSNSLNNKDESYYLSSGYATNYGLEQVSFSNDNNSNVLRLATQGSAVLHKGGLTFSQPSGDTFAIVNTLGSNHVYLENSKGLHSDFNGYMIVPNLTAYRKNTLHFVVKDSNGSTEIVNPVQNTTPAFGSVQLLNLNVRSGVKALLKLHFHNGYVPFGSTISMEQDMSNASIVGPEGIAYMSGMKSSGKLVAKWGKGPSDSCVAPYNLDDYKSSKKVKIIKEDLWCH